MPVRVYVGGPTIPSPGRLSEGREEQLDNYLREDSWTCVGGDATGQHSSYIRSSCSSASWWTAPSAQGRFLFPLALGLIAQLDEQEKVIRAEMVQDAIRPKRNSRGDRLRSSRATTPADSGAKGCGFPVKLFCGAYGCTPL